MSFYTETNKVYTLSPPLNSNQVEYLKSFSNERHCLRDESYLSLKSEFVREQVGLPVGKDGLYCVYGSNFTNFSDHMEDEAVIDLNIRAKECPELYCSWVPTNDGTILYWMNGEISHCIEEWLVFIEKHFLSIWGINITELKKDN